MKKVRKGSKATSSTEAVTRARRGTRTNREIELALKNLIRKGRGRFVDVYR